MKKIFATIIFSTMIATFPAPAFSAEGKDMRGSLNPKFSMDQCMELLKECMIATDGAERNNCIKDSADNFFCHGSPLGVLADKRWKLMAGSFENQENVPAPAEAKLVDISCLDNFDSLLYAKMNAGRISGDETRNLSQSLDSCKEKSIIELELGSH